MTDLGNASLLFVLAFSAFAAIATVLGAQSGRPRLVRSGERAMLAAFAMCGLSMVALWALLFQSDFRVEYVWGNSNRDLHPAYKIAALWAGQAGSLVLWTFVALLYGALVVLLNRHRNRSFMPWVVATIAGSAVFFALLNVFVANPFNEIAFIAEDGTVSDLERLPPDGKGLNPLLQHPAMAIHPPILYGGYVGFLVPFAFCVAALVTRRLGTDWIRTIRRWTLAAWALQGAGILLGGRWAYVELGWGGYWAWDPVENASLMPWLTSTAFLHSVMIQEKRGMLKVWNVVLILMTYGLCIFGTFTTRSGLMSSVHAFAESDIGYWFVGYLVVMVVGLLALLVGGQPAFLLGGAFTAVLLWREIGVAAGVGAFVVSVALAATVGRMIEARLPDLRTENRFEAMVSRESAFLFNNMVLLFACAAVFWGTMFPVLSEAVTGEKIVVLQPWFNKVEVPLAMILLFLTGAGPLIAWRRSSARNLWINLGKPFLLGVAVAVALFFAGVKHYWALISFGLSAFVIATIASEFYRGGRVRARSIDGNLLEGMLDLVQRNKRRYGGYIVHFSFVVLIIGFTGKAFDTETKVPVHVGDTISLRGYDMTVKEIVDNDASDPNFVAGRMTLELTRGDRHLATLVPESRFYKASEQTTTEVARWSGLHEDVYTVFVRSDPNGPPEVQMFVNPLIRLVWIGGWMMALGTLLTMMPDRRPSRRTALPATATAEASVAKAARAR